MVPEPYMDGIHYVPQAQQYCKENFRSWDPMITINEVVMDFCTRKSEVVVARFMMLCWGLWQNRDEQVWNQTRMGPEQICAKAQCILDEWTCCTADLRGWFRSGSA